MKTQTVVEENKVTVSLAVFPEDSWTKTSARELVPYKRSNLFVALMGEISKAGFCVDEGSIRTRSEVVNVYGEEIVNLHMTWTKD